jgi:hypothetical protein
MKLSVVSSNETVKAFGKLGYEIDDSTAAISFSVTPAHRTDACPFPTIKDSRKEPFGR